MMYTRTYVCLNVNRVIDSHQGVFNRSISASSSFE